MSKAKRWKPKQGEVYWHVRFDDSLLYAREVVQWTWVNDASDWCAYRIGNIFKTFEEAEAVARKLKGFWKDVREGKQ